ncbi:MAG: hypothetical protein ACKVQB_11305 [Bacteroidia bacterium]
MKTKFYFLILTSFLFSLTLTNCTGKRKLQKGNYEEALQRSIVKLRKSPGNEKAAKTLNDAYNLIVKMKMEEVIRLKASSDVFKWETIVANYLRLNYYYDEINRCPACLKVIPDPNRYTADLDEAKTNAAAARYDLGIEQLKLNTLLSAQNAYRHFAQAKNYVLNYKDIDKQMQLAKDAGTLRVVMEHIPMHSRTMQISNEFFENKIQEYLGNLNYQFVQFYTPEEAQTYNIKPHQYMQCRFDDFVVGQVYIHEKEQEISRDSVVLKTETLPNKEIKKTYGTVKATLHTFTKTLTSSGLLDMRIVDANTGSLISQNKLPGTFVWETRWGWFNGDERALTADQLNYIKQREAYPPAPQQLFIEFTKPIFNQVTGKINSFYNGYRL